MKENPISLMDDACFGTEGARQIASEKKHERLMGRYEALETAASHFEKQHCNGPLGEFNGKWVSEELRKMKKVN